MQESSRIMRNYPVAQARYRDTPVLTLVFWPVQYPDSLTELPRPLNVRCRAGRIARARSFILWRER